MSKLLFIACTWFIAGLMAYLFDFIRKKEATETRMPFIRCLFSGYLGFMGALFFLVFPPTPASEQEAKMYDK